MAIQQKKLLFQRFDVHSSVIIREWERTKMKLGLILRDKLWWCMECACVRQCWRQRVGLTYGNGSKIMTEKGGQKNRDGYCFLFLFLIREQYIHVGGRDPRSLFIGSGCWWMCHDSRISLEWRYRFESKIVAAGQLMLCCSCHACSAIAEVFKSDGSIRSTVYRKPTHR